MKRAVIGFCSLLFALYLNSCTDDSVNPDLSGTLSLTAKYSTLSLLKTAHTSAIEVNITKVIYILKEIKFKSQQDSTEGLYKTSPLILEMNLSGNLQDIGGLKVPSNNYSRLEFDIHRVEASDTASMTNEQRIKIRPFFESDKYSIIIEGQIIDGTTKKEFVYKSKINVKQKINFDEPIYVAPVGSVNVTMIFSSYNWFKDGGSILDPTDSKNTTKIDNNIRESIRTFKDDNKDGVKD